MRMHPAPPHEPPPQPPAGHRPGWGRRLASGIARLLGLLLWLAGAGFALLAAGLVAAVLWASTPAALPQTLRWAQDWLTDPATGTSPLQVEGARGSLTGGGRIAALRWQKDGLTIDIDGLTLAWEPSLWLTVLLDRSLTIERLAAQRVRVQDERPPSPNDAPLEPPQQLTMPWLRAVTMPLQVEAFAFTGPAALEGGPLVAHYRYGPHNGVPTHHLRIDELRWADGRYTAQAALLALQPMTLDVRLQATIETPPTPEVPAQTLRLEAGVQGDLGGAEALLQVRADVQPAPASPSPPSSWAPELRLQAIVRPWNDMPLERADLRLQDINVAQFWPQGPRSRLSGQWQATHLEAEANEAPAWRWQLQGQLRNAMAQPWNDGGLPLEQLDAQVELRPDRWIVHALRWRLGESRLDATGNLRWQVDGAERPWAERLAAAEGRLDVQAFDPQRLWSTWPAARLGLTAQADHRDQRTRWSLNLRPQAGSGPRAPDAAALPTVQAQGQWSGARLDIERLDAQWLDSRLQASGHLHTAGPLNLQASMRWTAPGLQLQGQLTWPWQGQPLDAVLDVPDAERLQHWSRRAVLAIHDWLPALDLPTQAAPLWQHRWQGQARVEANATGPAGQPPWPAQWALQIQAPRLTLTPTTPDASPQAPLAVEGVQARLRGQARQWQAEWQGKARIGAFDNGWTLDAAGRLQGVWPGGPGASDHRLRWEATRLQARMSGTPLGLLLELDQPVDLAISAQGHLSAQAGALRLTPQWTGAPSHTFATQPARLEWEGLRWANGRLDSRGRIAPVSLSWINAWMASPDRPDGPLAEAGFSGDLQFEGVWDVSLPLSGSGSGTAPARARLDGRHLGGDLTYLSGSGSELQRTPVGLEALQLGIQWQGQQATAQALLATRQFGRLQGRLTTQLTPPGAAGEGWQWRPDAPLEGELQARLTRMAPLSAFAPPGWRIDGEGQADARLYGTRAQPEWQGRIDLRRLALRAALDGIDFSDGELTARLDGHQMQIERLRLRGAGGADGGGLLTGEGRASWPRRADGPPRPDVRLTLQAQNLRLLARADRRLVLSGQIDSHLTDDLLDLRGRLDVDQALFLLPDETTPSLGSDVVIRGSSMPVPLSARLPFQIRLRTEVHLGERFEVRGLGLQTALRGRLLAEAQPGQLTPTLTGEVQTVRGTYRAYGQRLNIEQGLVRFNGPYDNPSLDILALRPHPTQKVGVEISGTAQAPRVRLYADPDLPDSEKLAWLVLGRPASGAGAEAAILQQAALALLSSGSTDDTPFAQRLGLDDLSFQGEAVNPDGSTTAAALTLGKRLTDQLYVSYSRSVVGAVGTVAVFLDLSRYLTLRAQAGDDNAIDLIFTHSFDGPGAPRTHPRPPADTSP